MQTNILKFVHANRIVEVRNLDPNETVLNYVRTKLKLIGSKESCASGDCSSCLMVLGEYSNNQVSYTTINSCIAFLPTIHLSLIHISEPKRR